MALLEWNDRYSVGIDTFDGHHKKLVALLNDLHDAMRQGKGADVLGPTLTELVNYTKQHFAAEERVMSQHGYPQFAAHKAEHEKLTAQVVDFKTQFDSGKTMLSVKMMSFLKDWLTNHIQNTDKQYTTFLKGKGVR